VLRSSYTPFDSLGLVKDTEFCTHGSATLWLQKEKGVSFKAVLRFGALSYVTSGMDPTLLRCKTRKIMEADLFIKCF
jgi:hypothetical protein